ncbi:MAG: 4Fe-4S binding protein [Candidatus Izemoplasmatales bacterium]
MNDNLRVTFDGLSLANPLMPASGPLVGDFEKLCFMRDSGLGAVVTKTISTKAPVIPRPCIYGDRDYAMNSELWSEHPLSRWTDDFLPAYMAVKDRPLIVSVGYSKEDIEVLIPALDGFADAFEVSTHYVGTDLAVIGRTVAAIRARTKKPIYMKVSPHLPDVAGFARTIRENGANGVVAINSLGPTMKVDLATRRIRYGNADGYAWTSGPVIKNLALAAVRRIKTAAPELTVIGVGGIQSAEDVLEFLLAGASATQMLSGALLRGKDLYAKIVGDMPAALAKYGFSSMAEVAATRLDASVSYEPVPPVLDEAKCTKCRLCVRVCPYFALELRERIEVDAAKCFGCGLCIAKCPTRALR